MAAVCGDAEVERDPHTLRYRAVGAPTEAALKVMVEKLARSQPTVARLCGALADGDKNDDDNFAAASMRACNFWYTHGRAHTAVSSLSLGYKVWALGLGQAFGLRLGLRLRLRLRLGLAWFGVFRRKLSSAHGRTVIVGARSRGVRVNWMQEGAAAASALHRVRSRAQVDVGVLFVGRGRCTRRRW